MEVLTTPSSPITFSVISRNVEDSINKVDALLEESRSARSEFQTQWTTLIKEIETDVALLETELARLPPTLGLFLEQRERERNETKRRKKRNKSKKNKPTSSSHALNFHMMKQANHLDGGVFLLPPEDESDGRDDNDTIVSERTSKLASEKRRHNPQLACIENKRQAEAQRKFHMREDILSKMEELRNYESKIMNDMKITDDKKDDKDGEKVNKAIEIERCQRKNSQLMMKMISQYKPKVISRRAKHMNVSRMVLNETMSEAAKLLEQNSKKSRRDNEESMIRDPNNYKSIEYLPLTTTGGLLKSIVSDATTTSHQFKTDEVNDEEKGSALNDDHYSDYDFESEEEEDYGSDSFET